jgi:hypothetical protein
VLAHLRACADVWGTCIVAMIEEDRPVLPAVNPRTWVKQTDSLDLEFRPSLRSFATPRAKLLAVLQPLPIDAWARAATGTGAGKVLERTVLFSAQWLARHERQHVKQVERLVNTMPREQRLPASVRSPPRRRTLASSRHARIDWDHDREPVKDSTWRGDRIRLC